MSSLNRWQGSTAVYWPMATIKSFLSDMMGGVQDGS